MQQLRITEEYLKSISTEEVAQLLSKYADRLLSINLQLDEVKAKRKATGEKSDPEWYGKITQAKRICGRYHQMLTKELASRRKVDATAKHEEIMYLRMFHDTAQENLDFTVMSALKAEAERRANINRAKERMPASGTGAV